MQRKSKPTGIAFIASSKIAVCHNLRIPSHQFFDGVTERGHGSMGWFYRFKLHLIINDEGGLLSVKITAGNIDDLKPVVGMYQDLWGAIYGDKGYIS